MSLHNDTVYASPLPLFFVGFRALTHVAPRYIQVHALAYMVKLYIEMNLAEMIGKVIKKSNRDRNECGATDGWHPDQGHLTEEGSVQIPVVQHASEADLQDDSSDEEEGEGARRDGGSLKEEDTVTSGSQCATVVESRRTEKSLSV